MDRNLLPDLRLGSRHPNWCELYKSTDSVKLPWFCVGLDADVKEQLQYSTLSGSDVLDVGTGVGNQAAELARRGYRVVGTDISSVAIEKARACHPEVTFYVDDISHSQLQQQFHLIVDRGCFHSLESDDLRCNYVMEAHRLLKPFGKIFLKTFRREGREGRDFGPVPLSEAELSHFFNPYFIQLSLTRTHFDGPVVKPQPAWFGVFQRKESHGRTFIQPKS